MYPLTHTRAHKCKLEPFPNPPIARNAGRPLDERARQ
jgi:hypothetical protein